MGRWGDGAGTARGKAERSEGGLALPFHQRLPTTTPITRSLGEVRAPASSRWTWTTGPITPQCPKGKQDVAGSDDWAGGRRYLDVLQMFGTWLQLGLPRDWRHFQTLRGTPLASSGLQVPSPQISVSKGAGLQLPSSPNPPAGGETRRSTFELEKAGQTFLL